MISEIKSGFSGKTWLLSVNVQTCCCKNSKNKLHRSYSIWIFSEKPIWIFLILSLYEKQVFVESVLECIDRVNDHGADSTNMLLFSFYCNSNNRIYVYELHDNIDQIAPQHEKTHLIVSFGVHPPKWVARFYKMIVYSCTVPSCCLHPYAAPSMRCTIHERCMHWLYLKLLFRFSPELK